LEIDRRWDFREYKFHPLWNTTPEEEPELRIKPGDVLFRGTTTAYTDGGVKVHEWRSASNPEWMAGPRRIYMSEGAEDAAGYGSIAAEDSGGQPVLCEIVLDEELFRQLKPGYEGKGEWYVERESIPKKNVRCIRLRKGEYGDVEVPWEKLRR
jgi:hypothetical protein